MTLKMLELHPKQEYEKSAHGMTIWVEAGAEM